jgi:hypothetical protein
MTTTTVPFSTIAPPRRADLVGRGLVGFAAVMTGVAFVNGLLMAINATDDRLFVEGWRVSSFAIFAGLFALLAFRPRRSAGVWELLLVGKSALTVFGFLAGNVPEARLAAVIDLTLVAVVATAYVLCRGWLAWHPTTTSTIR